MNQKDEYFKMIKIEKMNRHKNMCTISFPEDHCATVEIPESFNIETRTPNYEQLCNALNYYKEVYMDYDFLHCNMLSKFVRFDKDNNCRIIMHNFSDYVKDDGKYTDNDVQLYLSARNYYFPKIFMHFVDLYIYACTLTLNNNDVSKLSEHSDEHFKLFLEAYKIKSNRIGSYIEASYHNIKHLILRHDDSIMHQVIKDIEYNAINNNKTLKYTKTGEAKVYTNNGKIYKLCKNDDEYNMYTTMKNKCNYFNLFNTFENNCLVGDYNPALINLNNYNSPNKEILYPKIYKKIFQIMETFRQHNFVHGDFHGGNIMIDRDDIEHVEIIDLEYATLECNFDKFDDLPPRFLTKEFMFLYDMYYFVATQNDKYRQPIDKNIEMFGTNSIVCQDYIIISDILKNYTYDYFTPNNKFVINIYLLISKLSQYECINNKLKERFEQIKALYFIIN